MALVSGWIAVDDVTGENGCVRVITGSHKLGPQPHSDVWKVGERNDMKIPDRLIDRSRERLLVMKAGSVSFHHSLLMHASGPNRSASFRRGYAFHYMSAQSRWTGDPAKKPEYLLLRGREYPGCVLNGSGRPPPKTSRVPCSRAPSFHRAFSTEPASWTRSPSSTATTGSKPPAARGPVAAGRRYRHSGGGAVHSYE
jgi:hypothetical protein